jgi:hypothetical protein
LDDKSIKTVRLGDGNLIQPAFKQNGGHLTRRLEVIRNTHWSLGAFRVAASLAARARPWHVTRFSAQLIWGHIVVDLVKVDAVARSRATGGAIALDHGVGPTLEQSGVLHGTAVHRGTEIAWGLVFRIRTASQNKQGENDDEPALHGTPCERTLFPHSI